MELAELVNTLPAQERLRYQREIGQLAHDVRSAMGVILTAESLLRRQYQGASEDVELLDMIRNAGKRVLGLMTDFSKPFDGEIMIQTSQNP
jgi:signal transduction histidine kinase